MRAARPALALALALWATGGAAQAGGPDCAALLAGLQALPGYVAEVPPAVPNNGFCVLDGLRLTSRAPGWPDLTAEWVRVGGGDGWASLKAQGLRLAPRLGDRELDDRLRQMIRLQTADLSLRLTETDGALEVTSLDLTLSGGTRLVLSARLQGAGLSLATIPGALLTDLALDWQSNGRLMRPVLDLMGEGIAIPAGTDRADAARDRLAAAVKALPGSALAPGSRAALAAMVAELPQGHGRLVLRLTSPEGVGAAALGRLALSDAPLGPEALERLLSGATVTADWQPGLPP